AARVHVREVALLLLVGAELLDDLGGAVGQARIHVEGRVGAREELLDGDPERERRALAFPLRRDGDRLPARLVDLLPRLLEALRRLHRAVLDAAPLATARGVQGPEHLARELVGLVDDHRGLVVSPRLHGSFAEDVYETE